MNPVRLRNGAFHCVTASLFTAFLVACEQDAACSVEPFIPTGPEAAFPCDCPDGILFYCKDATSCSGVVGATTCEDGLGTFLNQCTADCEIGFLDSGAVFYDCPARGESG